MIFANTTLKHYTATATQGGGNRLERSDTIGAEKRSHNRFEITSQPIIVIKCHGLRIAD